MSSEPPTHITLRNERPFPNFMDLPRDFDIDQRYLRYRSPTMLEPLRHWCLLVEVIQTQKIIRLIVSAFDKTGQLIIIALYTPDRGKKLRKVVKPGCTLAILYARQHFFFDGSVGVRVENPHDIKVIQHSLYDLFRVSDGLQLVLGQFFNNKTRCHGCGQTKENLKKCSKCGCYWYCNKECQAVGWKEKMHKEECKILQDPDFPIMLTMDWEKFHSFHGFPLKKN